MPTTTKTNATCLPEAPRTYRCITRNVPGPLGLPITAICKTPEARPVSAEQPLKGQQRGVAPPGRSSSSRASPFRNPLDVFVGAKSVSYVSSKSWRGEGGYGHGHPSLSRAQTPAEGHVDGRPWNATCMFEPKGAYVDKAQPGLSLPWTEYDDGRRMARALGTREMSSSVTCTCPKSTPA